MTTRQAAFVPAQSGLGFIRIKGITFQHAANAHPFPQFGMISCAGGDHWIVEDNTIEWANGGGLSIGRDANSGAARQAGASHILRRNTIRYCGIEGIDEKTLTFIEAMTEAAAGPTHRRPDGSLSHW